MRWLDSRAWRRDALAGSLFEYLPDFATRARPSRAISGHLLGEGYMPSLIRSAVRLRRPRPRLWLRSVLTVNPSMPASSSAARSAAATSVPVGQPPFELADDPVP